MILVDSSIWIDHLRMSNNHLTMLLAEKQVLGHPFAIGEIAVGSIKDREDVLKDLHGLPRAEIARDEDVLHFISRHSLFGLGIGYIDLHLLLSARMGIDTKLWTRDRRLLGACVRLGVDYHPSS